MKCENKNEHKDCYTDEYGCHHDCGIGWNPNGRWCGECTREGKDCPAYNLQNNEYTSKDTSELSIVLMDKITASYNNYYKMWKDAVTKVDDIFDKNSTYILGLHNILSWVNNNIIKNKDEFLEYYLQPDNKMYFEMMLELDDFITHFYNYLSSCIATRLDNPYATYLDSLTIERLKDILFGPIDIVLYKKHTVS